MFILHIFAGLVLGFTAALWSYTVGYSLSAMLCFYILGGNFGLVGSALLSFLRSWTPMQSEPLGVSQGA